MHFACRAYTIPDLADLLPEIAPAYVTLPVLDQTNLKGAYDFKLDWMGRGAYDAAIANQAAGVPKDPLAVSIYDAVAKLGLSLEKREIAKTRSSSIAPSAFRRRTLRPVRRPLFRPRVEA